MEKGKAAAESAPRWMAPAMSLMVDFLNAVDEFPCLYGNERVLYKAILRCEKVWLPLVLSQPDKVRMQLVPPIDVEWVWQAHKLGVTALD